MTSPTKYTITHSITGTVQPAVLLPADRISHLIGFLDHCEQFLGHASRVVHSELADYCQTQSNLNSGWLIDMLGFAALQLRTDLEEAGLRKPPMPKPVSPAARASLERW